MNDQGKHVSTPSEDLDWAFIRAHPGVVWEESGHWYVGIRGRREDTPTLRERLVEGVRMTYVAADLDFLHAAIDVALAGPLEEVSVRYHRSPFSAVRLLPGSPGASGHYR